MKQVLTYFQCVLLMLFCLAAQLSHADTNNTDIRSSTQVYRFRSTHPCPANGSKHAACPGYVVDHKQALECGGKDDPSNMQWQTVAAAKLKDKTERLCHIKKGR